MKTPIPVHCRHHEMLALCALVENPRNPNRHPIEQVKALAQVIEKNGWRSPIVVSHRSGFIVKGHGRFEAAKLLAAAAVPVEYQAYESEAEEWADMIADNRIAELAEIDTAALHSLLAEASATGLDLAAAGFSAAAFKELEKVVHGSSPGAVATAAAEPDADVTSEKVVIGKYQVEVSRQRADAFLADLYATFNNDENLVIAEVRKRIGL